MKLVAAAKLLPTPDQAAALKATLERCNAAATWAAAESFKAGLFRRYDLHRITYHAGRARFGLTAQAMVLTLDKVADAFKVNREVAPVFRPLAAQAYDERIFRFVQNGAAVNLWTVEGRLTVACVTGEHQRKLLAYRKGQADLAFIRGRWFLLCTCDVPETKEFEPEDWLGVDLGIVNLAVDSKGQTFTGAAVERVRRRHHARRRALQKKGTRSAKRALKRASGKQRRFQRVTNHTISKAIVAVAERDRCGIAVEDLGGIRDRVQVTRRQRARLHNWGFFELRSLIAYKAKRVGVPVAHVDPRNTSQQCACCGLIDKRNRPNRDIFRCIGCNVAACPDANAALNIRQRALGVRGILVMAPQGTTVAGGTAGTTVSAEESRLL